MKPIIATRCLYQRDIILDQEENWRITAVNIYVKTKIRIVK